MSAPSTSSQPTGARPASSRSFDPALGTLTGVTIQLDGQILGAISYENQDAEPATITSTLDGCSRCPAHPRSSTCS